MVESEGNGRMCLTLPQTLITVMGIEKLVPTWRDLEVFLQLLPRSSTGERMNPYTSMWTGVTPGDGPQDVHLVLLDNGRTAALADEVGREALQCIKCSACMNVCPVYERTGGHAYGSVYPGPIGAVLSPYLTGVEDNASLPYASSLCGACLEACPVKIDIPSMLVDLRHRHVEAQRDASPVPTPERGRDGHRVLGDGRPAPVGRRPGRLAAGPAARPRRPDPHPAVAAVRLDRRARRARAARGDVPRPVGPYAWGSDGRPHRAPRSPRQREPGGRLMSAREDVLSRVRRALAGATPAGPVPRDYRARGESPPGSPALLDLLEDRLVDYKAGVRRTDPAGVPAAVAAALAAGLARRDLTPQGCTVVVPPGLDAAWSAAQPGRVLVDDGTLSAPQLDDVHAVVTASTVAVAETGTIVLDGSRDQGRRALSLVPDLHVLVVRAEQVVADRPRGRRPPRPHPPAHLDQRAERHQRHRARPRRGRPRAAHPRGRPRRLSPVGGRGADESGVRRASAPVHAALPRSTRMRMIFVNLPVTDLAATRAFWSSLGFGFDEQYSDDAAACLVISDSIFAMLLTEARFADFSPLPVADARATKEVLLCLTCDRPCRGGRPGRAGAGGRRQAVEGRLRGRADVRRQLPGPRRARVGAHGHGPGRGGQLSRAGLEPVGPLCQARQRSPGGGRSRGVGA